jgi:hypothetical protein
VPSRDEPVNDGEATTKPASGAETSNGVRDALGPEGRSIRPSTSFLRFLID